ncbi:MAG: cob(I)yrinic acid a,c-diamide adenosyltransferase [Thermoplasmatales archaeon]
MLEQNCKIRGYDVVPMYTRRGDKGETDTAYGERIRKDSQLIEWEGTLDELISSIGFSKSVQSYDDIVSDLTTVQLDLFHLGEEIITLGEGRKLRDDGVKWMEDRISSYLKEIGQIKLFVVPGGSISASSLQLSRAIARRAERRLVELAQRQQVNPNLLQYINRLSSFLFMIAVVNNKRAGIKEIIYPWPNPEKSKEE